MRAWFHCWSLEFQLLWLIDSLMGLCDPPPVNTWTLRRVWVFSTSDSAVLCWRKSLCLVSSDEEAWQGAPVPDNWGFCQHVSFLPISVLHLLLK